MPFLTPNREITGVFGLPYCLFYPLNTRILANTLLWRNRVFSVFRGDFQLHYRVASCNFMIFCPLDVLEDSGVSITPAQFVSTACRRDFTSCKSLLGAERFSTVQVELFSFPPYFSPTFCQTKGQRTLFAAANIPIPNYSNGDTKRTGHSPVPLSPLYLRKCYSG